MNLWLGFCYILNNETHGTKSQGRLVYWLQKDLCHMGLRNSLAI